MVRMYFSPISKLAASQGTDRIACFTSCMLDSSSEFMNSRAQSTTPLSPFIID